MSLDLLLSFFGYTPMQEGRKLSLYFTPICTTFFQGVAERKNSQASSAPNAQLHNHLFSFGYPD